MPDNDVEIKISGDPTGAQKAFKDTTAAAKAAADGVSSAFEGLGAVFDAMRDHLGAITAVLAGGAIFKESVDVAKEFTGQVTQLSKQLGISAEEASGLNVALETIGSSSDSYTDALSKLTRQVRTNEAGLNAMGIATRDSNGHFLDGRALMDSAIKALLEYKEGTDRNLAAQVAFGKGAQEAAAMLKLSNEVQEAGAKKAHELNLIIGAENQSAVKAYKVGLAEVREVLTAVENTIGQAMMPVLTQLAEWFSSMGPAAIAAFKPIMAGVAEVLQIVVRAVVELWNSFASAFNGILKLVAYASLVGDGSITSFGDVCTFVFNAVKIALLVLEMGFTVTFGVIGAAIELASATLRRFGTTADAAFRNDWSGAKAAWAAGTAEIEAILDRSGERILKSTQRSYDQANAIWDGNNRPIDSGTGDGWDAKKPKKTYNGEGAEKEKKNPSRAPQWEAELAEQKLALQELAAEYGIFYEMSKADEREFWQDKLALTVAGTAENVAVRKKSAELGLAIQKDAFDVELQGLKTQADAFKNNMTARIAIAEQEATLIGQKYGTESKEYLAVQGEIVKLEREAAAQALQIEEAKQASLRQVRLSEIDLAQEIASERYALGQINEAQLLQLERRFEDQRTQIAVSAQQARIAAMASDRDHSPAALEKEKAQLLAIEEQHALAVQKINGKIAVEAQSTFKTMSDSISAAFANMFESLLTRQQSFSQASIALGNAVLSAAIKAVLDEKAVKEAVWNGLSAVYEVLAGTKRATDAASSTEAIVAKKVEAVSIINAEAGEAAAGAAASVAGIPIVGPALAATAFAETMAMVLGGALPLASAAGGYDIPRSINPIVQTHAREMILPAELADRVRAVTPGGGNSGGGNGTTINMHFNGPTSPREHEKWIAEHLAGAMLISNRNFRIRAR